ncbi:MAG: tetratricopeptide repeat protein [Bacteroidaceae bacterium]|nr:tetratricopeptide repeat protein [Bacteroidaceae bacterium]
MQAIIRILSLLVFCCSFSVVSAQQTKFNYIFQEAMRQKLANKYDAAIDLFDYCHQLDPESGAVLYELAELYRYAKNDTLAIKALEKACRLYPNNYWYKNHLVTLYLDNRRNDEALQCVEDMARLFPEKGEVLGMLLELYEKKNDYANMVKVLDKIEVKEGKSEKLSMGKFRLFLQMNDEARAFEEMRNLADEYPNDLRYQVVIGDLYLDAGKKEEALKQFQMVEAQDPENVTLLLSMANFYNQEGDTAHYQDYLTRLLTNKDVDDATRVRMLGVLVRENLTTNADSTQLLSLFDKVLQQPQEQTDILELKVRYMVTKRMPADEVKPYLKQMLDIDPENDMARQQLLKYAVEENDHQSIVNICKPAVEYNADSPVFYFYMGVEYYLIDEKEKSMDALRSGLNRVENEMDEENRFKIRTHSYALLGDIYHQFGQDDKAFQAYDSCLIYNKNDAMVLNNYAYYLSLKKKDLQRAEEMSRLSNELEPDNATYLDTYAWVLFQQKRYDEAKQYMDKVVELMERDGEEMSDDVQDHIKQINKKAKKK